MGGVLTTALVDADIVLSRISYSIQTSMDWGDGTYSDYADEHEGRAMLDLWVTSLYTTYPEIVLCFSDSSAYWRRDVFPTYKNNRTKAKPLVFAALKEYAKETYECVQWPRLEADDVLGILATAGEYADAVVLSLDKDLDCIPCRRQRAVGEEIYTVTPEQAEQTHLVMAFSGDPTDGFPGCPRVGPKTARKYLAPYLEGKCSKDWAWGKILGTYEERGKDEEFALAQARCAYILQSGDYDPETHEVRYWSP